MPKQLPIGTHTFSHIIEEGFLYVDKTKYLYDLIHPAGGIYFISRPRRFGKSLFLSTLNEIFQGNKELFQGLWIYDSPYQWESHPVIHLDLSRLQVTTAEELTTGLKQYLRRIARQYQITLEEGPYYAQFDDLIYILGTKKKVVILIDEYDKPILDNVENLAEAKRIQDILKRFYTIIKAMDAYVHFVFITGITKFTRIGIFSTLNNLNDITMHYKYATALGITEEELTTYFLPYITEFASKQSLSVDDLLLNIKQWYNGFRFTLEEKDVYNPYSLMLFLDHQRFSDFWFASGTPTFLMKLIRERNYNIELLEKLNVAESTFSSYEIEKLKIIPLLFQTGYLTIKGYDSESHLYQLYYPNYEVENAFLNHLMDSFVTVEDELIEDQLWQLVLALKQKDLVRFFEIIDIVLSNVPYDIHIKHEKYYQTIFYLIFKLIGLRVDVEVRTNSGRIDAVVELADHIFLFEFKLDDKVEKALKQIKEHEYYKKYRLRKKARSLVGANFDSTKRKIEDWKEERDR